MIWIESDNPNGFQTGKRFSIGQPAPCVMAGGMGGDSLGHWHFHNDSKATPMPRLSDKPPYSVPTMEAIRALPWNGLRVASTFAGGGGSSTGYRMAGCKVVWANELTQSARDSYAANMAPETILDGRDIRKVQASDILKVTGLAEGELDIFDGSPPCVSFSTAGRREKGWGKVTTSHDATQRQDDLFFEYARLLKGLRLRAFVAENVSGLVKGTAKGYFLEILAVLKACGYRVEARLLDAQWLGVPQMRQRLIFVGTRLDLATRPSFPAPLGYRYSVRDALPWIGGLESGHGFHGHAMETAAKPVPVILAGRAVRAKVIHDTHGTFNNAGDVTNRPCPSIVASGAYHFSIEAETDISRFAIGAATAIGGTGSAASIVHPTERRKFTIAELKRICAFPDDYELKGSYADQWARCGNAVPPLMMRAIAETIRDRVLGPLDRSIAA